MLIILKSIFRRALSVNGFTTLRPEGQGFQTNEGHVAVMSETLRATVIFKLLLDALQQPWFHIEFLSAAE